MLISISMEYEKKTRRELIAICKEKGIRGYSDKNKEMICLLIEKASQNTIVNLTMSITNIVQDSVIDESIVITSKKYKTFGEFYDNLKREEIISLIQTTQESVIDESIAIKSKKYKTIGDLKKAGIKSMIQVTARMDRCIGRDYLDKWIWDTYYSKKEMLGNLTMRIDNINNSICYREIMKRCFGNVDILSNNTTKEILSKPSIELIKELHTISPSPSQ